MTGAMAVLHYGFEFRWLSHCGWTFVGFPLDDRWVFVGCSLDVHLMCVVGGSLDSYWRSLDLHLIFSKLSLV